MNTCPANIMTLRVFFNLFCQNVEAQLAFYQTLLGLPEITAKRSPIYRALDAGSTELGFNATQAYELLSLAARAPAEHATAATTGYATFMLPTPDAVDEAAAQTAALGGQVIKAPYATYYREWQAVLQDPEGNVFRASAALKP